MEKEEENMRMRKEHAINFLLYNMLGVTVGDMCYDKNCKDTDKDRIKAAIIRAYSDATMQGAYNTQLNETLKEQSEKAKKEAGTLLYDKIYEFFKDGSKCDNYDEWHFDLCTKLKEKYMHENINFFTYGNAQKWVNMTIKYLNLIDALSEGFIFHERLCKFQSKFHIPVDSYIIEAIWEKDSLWEKNDAVVYIPFKEEVKEKENMTENPMRDFRNKKKNHNPQNYVKAWSSWAGGKNFEGKGEGSYEDSEYGKFQQEIKNNVIKNSFPLNWENETWIIQAKRRKLREKRSNQDKYEDFGLPKKEEA